MAALSEGFCPADGSALTPCQAVTCPDLHGYCDSCGLWWILRAADKGI